MTMNELVEECVAAINRVGAGHISLVGKGKAPLPRKGYPRGIFLCENCNGDHVYAYDATRLLAALVAHGYVDVVKR